MKFFLLGCWSVGVVALGCGLQGANRADGGSSPNVVPNPGFESGDLGWTPQFGTLEIVGDARTGASAAKLTASSTGQGVFSYPTPVVSDATADHYCATGWVKGTVGNAKLSILTHKNGAGVDTSFSSPVATSAWIRMPPSIVLAVPNTAGMNLYVRFLLSQGKPGDTLLVDDVDVWESADGKCNETR